MGQPRAFFSADLRPVEKENASFAIYYQDYNKLNTFCDGTSPLFQAPFYICLIKGCGSSVLEPHTQLRLNDRLHVPFDFFFHMNEPDLNPGSLYWNLILFLRQEKT